MSCSSWSRIPTTRRSARVRSSLGLVVTLDPSGGDGHCDHVRIAQATTAAFDKAAPAGSTLYCWCLVRSVKAAFLATDRLIRARPAWLDDPLE